MYAKAILIILLPLLFDNATAQDYSGTWTGGGDYLPGLPITTVMTKMGAGKKLVFTINTAGIVSGSLTATYDKSKASLTTEAVDQRFIISGTYDPFKKLLLLVLTQAKVLSGTSETYLSFKKPDSLFYELVFSHQENKVEMTGVVTKKLNKNITAEWIGSASGAGLGMNISDEINMHLLPLRIKLESTLKPLIANSELPHKDTVSIRRINIQHTITLDTSFIKIDLYDNGEIDGDIATLILDGKTIINRQLLSAKAASLTLNLSKEPAEHLLELFANNLGSIPPNTALLVLTCKNKRYEINLSSNETINGSVKLKFKTN